jgi:hypothetical protein
VPVERIELPPFGLQNRCSTAELNRQISENTRLSIPMAVPNFGLGSRLGNNQLASALGRRNKVPFIGPSGPPQGSRLGPSPDLPWERAGGDSAESVRAIICHRTPHSPPRSNAHQRASYWVAVRHGTGFLSQSKSGRTSAPCWPQAVQVNLSSRSDNRVWSGHGSALTLIQCEHW